MEKSKNNLFEQALVCLEACDPGEKVQKTLELNKLWLANGLNLLTDFPVNRIINPGRPEKPELVHPREVPKRGFSSEQGRIRLAHAIAHIEFNAINLALDAVYRFHDMPVLFYTNWLQVAAEEAHHFTLLNDYLIKKGAYYGEYPAHNGLWEMALKSDHDVLVRMALVPRVLEARGLDVTPNMIKKLMKAGDTELVDVLDIIYRDEIGHVKIGSHWFYEGCRQLSVLPENKFSELLDEYISDAVFGPFDDEIRLQAGFNKQELINLENRRSNVSKQA